MTVPLAQFMNDAKSVLVGTVDADGYPATCRGIALTASPDFETVTVYIPVATGQETIANVATTRRLAVGATHPISHASYQFKGVTRGVRLARAEEESLVKAALDGFAEILDTIGVPKRITRSFAHWPAFAIDVQVEQIFDQTPGPKAGAPLR